MKRHAPAALRNRDPILSALREILPTAGKVLEIGCGSGEHAIHFSGALPSIRWQPSDVDPSALESLEAYRREAGAANLLAAAALDTREPDWGPVADELAAIVCINVIHISPWAVARGLFAGAQRHLPAGAPLVTYGPYRFDGTFTAPSNETFDRSLRHRDPSWGVRDIGELDALGAEHALRREQTLAMPANNHVLVYRRTEDTG